MIQWFFKEISFENNKFFLQIQIEFKIEMQMKQKIFAPRKKNSKKSGRATEIIKIL